MPVFSNATIVLPDSVIKGHMSVSDGRIADVQDGAAAGEDFEGDFLIPGLVELHTDHLETHVAPRPRVRWNLTAAVQAHDAQMTASGITTVFDALRVGSDGDGELASLDGRQIGEAVLAAQAEGRLRANHKFHLRCEVSNEAALPGYELFEDLDGVRLISLMDHTP
ncbi:MAG: alpha-D-ribose 1-methylphosphonate 5-triphosphate diphosphatase, partial [Pseudomonadota bacterium]